MLKDIRESKGLSQSQLAGATGMSVRTLQAYERGATNINGAQLKTLLQLAFALDCKIEDILSDARLIAMMKEYSRRN